MAADRDQARSIFRYIGALLKDNPMLAPLVLRETAESFELNNRVVDRGWHGIIQSKSRGYSYAAVLADELAFWRSDESTNPDVEILRALRPGLLTMGGKMLCASSPYGRKGSLWEAFQRYYGKDDASVLVWKAPTRAMNPTVSESDIAAEYERDPASAAAEYGAEFRTDVEGFVSLEAVQACMGAERERLPDRRYRYYGFCDPSGGSNDAMTLAIAHKAGVTVVLDAIREIKPPFSPEAVVEEFAKLLRSLSVHVGLRRPVQRGMVPTRYSAGIRSTTNRRTGRRATCIGICYR